MLEKISQADMEEGEGQDLATTVLTCEGDLHDPGFPGRLRSLVLRLRELISDEEQPLWVKKVEPWNSVRVTFTLPRDAALRLRQLAQRGDRALRELGILSVQVEGDQIISLTLAGRYGEPPKEIIIQKAAEEGGEQGSPASPHVPGVPSSSQALASAASSRAGSSSATTTPAEPPSIQARSPAFAAAAATSTSGSSGSAFRSPNVVAPPPREPLPFLSSGSSRLVRPSAKTRPPFPFASMTHSMKQNSAAAAAAAAAATTTSGSRFPFSPSPPLAAALGAAQRLGNATRGNVALSSPLLVNLLQSETGSGGPQKTMMPPPLDTGQPTKRKRRPPKGSRGKEGCSPPGSPCSPPPTSPSCDVANVLGSRGFPLSSHIPASPPRAAPTATVSVAPPSPPAAVESRTTTHLINPFTGHLEPMPSDEEDDEPAVRDLETSESSENGGHSERSLSDGSTGGKDPGNPSSDTDSGIGKSSSSQSSNDPEPPLREEVSRVSLPPTEGEKLKLRLKLDSKRTCPVKTEIEASPPPSPQGEPPRVPPLHISLRGPNVAVVVSPRKPEAAPKKRSPRSPRSSNGAEGGGGGNDARRGYRGARARADKGAERTRELSLLSGGGIVRVPVSMSPTVVLTPLQLQHPMGAGGTRRTLPSPSSSSSSPSSSSPSSASSSSCAQSTKPHWSATSLGPEADSSVSDGSSPLRDRPDLPHALRSADHDTGSATSATTTTAVTTVAVPPRQAGNNEPAANSALGALECHTTPHRTAPRPGSVPTPETNGVLHTDEEEQRSPSPCRASPSSLAKTTTVAMMSAIEKKPLANCIEGPITNHVGSTKGDGVDELREMAERRLSPSPVARIISLDAVATKKATFGGPVFEVSDVDVPAALKLGGLVGGNHRMPLLISTGGGGGTTFRGDMVLRQEYAAATHHHPHHHFHCTTANSVLKPGIVRRNRLRFGAGFAATTAASAVVATGMTQPRVEATASSVAAKTNGIASSSPLQNECDSTIDAESSLDSDDLVPNGPSTTSLVAAASLSASATSQTLSAASAIVSRSDGFSELPLSRGLCDSATNGSADFVAVVGSDNGVTTTGRAEENGEGVSPDSNHEPLPRDPLGPSDTDGDKSGDEEEASSALSEERGSSVSPPSEDPCSNIPPDRPSSASLPPAAPSPLPPPPSSSPETTAVVVASSQSMATPSEAAAPPSLTVGAAVVASSISSSSSSSSILPSSSCLSPTTWDSPRPATTSDAAEAMPRTQPQPAGSLEDVPTSTLQVPGGQMISPSMWSTAGSSNSGSGASNDPQQRLAFIFKGNLTASTTASSASPTSGPPVLALPASSGSGVPKTVPIKLLALPSGASGLALKSSLAELISSPATQGGSSCLAASRSVSPPIRLVVSKMAPTVKGAGNTARAVQSPTSTPLLTSSPSLVNMLMKSVMATAVTATTTVAHSPAVTSGAEAALTSVSSGTAPLSVNAPLPPLPEERQPVVSGVCLLPGEEEAPIKPDSREATCAMAATPSVVVTEADTRGGVVAALSTEVVPTAVSEAGSNGGGECGGMEKGPLSAERLASPTLLSGVCADLAEDGELAVLSPSVIANHIGSPQLPDSLSTLLDMAIDPPDDDDDDESELASNRDSPLAVSLLLTNHKDSEEEPHMREHEADLELLRTCPEASVVCVPGDELGDDGRLRNQRRRAAQVPSSAAAEEGESDHSSEEEMSLSELAHKSRVRPPRPQRQGKENEVLAASVAAADSPAPTTRREDGGPGRPRRLTATGSGESKAARSRLGQQQAMASQQSQALLSPSPVATVASLPAEEALRRNADRSRRSPATMPVGRDHRSPPRLPNQRSFRRDSEVRDDDAVVVMKRKTRASGPSTDPQQEAAAPNKRRRYSKDSHR